jgi:hypothetical protein
VLALARPTLPGTLAHPLTEPYELPFSPVVAAVGAAVLVFAVALLVPRGGRRAPEHVEARVSAESRYVVEALTASWAGSLSVPQGLGRTVAVLLLVLSIAAGRLGTENELDNLAPALIVGVAWPLLFLGSIVVGPVWRWLDPWDGMARALAGGGESPGATVWPAAIVVMPWLVYLSAYTDTLSPRSVGAAVAVYSVFTVAGCLLVGRERWLSTSEPLGIALSWMALLPRRRLSSWMPPRGAEALLGVLAGGVLFGAVRRSELWGGLNTVDAALALATVGVLVSSLVFAIMLGWFARVAERQGAPGSTARAAVPAVAGIVVAVAMDQNRLTTSLQLLPALLGDPFGRGWDLFGRAGSGIAAAPLGVEGLLVAQLAVLVVGHAVGAIVLALGVERGERKASAIALALLAGASVIALISH